MRISSHDRSILRQLAEQQMQVAAQPINAERKARWSRVNSLQKERPLLSIYQIPWHEMNGNGELTLQTLDPDCRLLETNLRRSLYQWQHIPWDMVIDPYHCQQIAIRDTGFGLTEDVEIVATDATNDVVSRHFHPQIEDEADLEKIRTPCITVDHEATAREHAELTNLFGDILPIRRRCAPSTSGGAPRRRYSPRSRRRCMRNLRCSTNANGWRVSG